MVPNEDVQTLMEAGLTTLQARVYLSLVSAGKSNGRKIWKNSSVSRQDVYRVLDELQNKGLIEKVLTIPTEYRAIPIQDGLSTLLKRKAEKYKEVEIKLEELLHRYKSLPEEKIQEEQQFILIPAKEAHAARINQTFIKVQKSIDTIIAVECTEVTNPKYLPPLLRRAITRGVRVRQISNLPKDSKSTIKSVFWTKKGSYELRFINEKPPTMLCLVDEKEVFFALDSTSNPINTEALWTNNPGLVSIATVYFENLWQKIIKEEKQKKQTTNENKNPAQQILNPIKL
ncbi:MAG: hypothetical protein GX638_00010 [Crenarchaeota archaeon]|nr:hypothetical protein [Thermoproteota archaeon]